MSDAATEVGGRDELAGRQLVVMTAQGSHRFDLPRAGTVTIGRGEGQDIRIEDASMSRAHAVLHVSTGEFFEVGAVVCAIRGAAAAAVAAEPAELVIAAPAMRKLHELVDRVDGTFLEPMIGRTQADVTALFAIDGTLFVGGIDGVLDILVFRR